MLYLLDADSDFLHTLGVVQFLAGTDQMPETILVGVVNTIRSRDLTPPSDDAEETAFWPAVGGADRFRRFLRNELIPAIDSSYRTVPFRTIRGQSFGGLFAIHDYMSAEPIFDAYLTSSPAVGWNHDALVERVPEFFAGDVPRPLYVGAAGRDFPGNLAAILRFATALETVAPADVDWRLRRFDDESHYSLVHRATYDALRFLYAGWQAPDSVVVEADLGAIQHHYAGLSERFGYTIPIPMSAIIRIGNGLLREQRWADGIAVLERNIELYPDQPESYWHVGDAHLLAGDPDGARPYFEQAVESAEALHLPDVDDYRRSLEELHAH